MHKFWISLGLIFELLAITPTENILLFDDLNRIEKHLSENYSDDFNHKYQAEKDELIQITWNESEEGFLGYHATSQYVRIMQDILQVVFEEKLNLPISDDFYFFRIPGKELHDLPGGVDDFISIYDKGFLTEEELTFLLNVFLFKPLENSFQIELKTSDLDEADLDHLLQPLKDLKLSLNAFYYTFQAHKIKGFNPSQSSSINSYFLLYRENVLPYIYFDPEVIKKVAPKLYKESLHGLISYKDFEKWLLKELHPYELFNKVYSHFQNSPFKAKDPLKSYFYPFLDYFSDTSSLLLSCNYSLFSNFQHGGDSSLQIYLNGQSIAFKSEYRIINELKSFFSEIGMDEGLAYDLFYLSLDHLKEVQGGTLFQIWDKSKNHLILKDGYVSFSAGVPAIKVSLEKLLFGQYSLKYDDTHHLQLRILMTNQRTLNPFSFLKMKRYDHTPIEKRRSLMNDLKKRIKSAPIDKRKKESYLLKMGNKWNLP